MKRLLAAVRYLERYYMFIDPILAELDDEFEIILVAPDGDKILNCGENRIHSIQQPVEVGGVTEFLRKRFRGAMAYIYWALLGVQNPQALERALGNKFKKSIKSTQLRHSIVSMVRWLKKLRLNRIIANLVLRNFRRFESVTIDRGILAQVKSHSPDVILATPGVYPHTWEIDYIKAGMRIKIPTIVLVASWDHLSGKGWLSVLPDRLLVWNDMQVNDAKHYHSVPENKIALVGSPVFDWLFDQKYLDTQDVFFQRAQLDPERPYILWAASAPGNCKDEPGVVYRLIKEIRRYPSLENVQVLIRPHPSPDATKWLDWRVQDAPIWPTPSFPTNDEVRRGLYNSIVYATAVVGLSTSVFLEAGILDRPVALFKMLDSVEDAVFNKSLHFKYLLEKHFPEAVENEAECARWLAQIVKGFDGGKDARREFISRFLRPQGIDRSSAQVAAGAILKLVNK